jgi:osmotically-inducible protein OsmY
LAWLELNPRYDIFRLMKIFVSLVVGLLIGGAVVWFYGTKQGKSLVQTTGEKIGDAAVSARDSVQGELKVLDLRTDDIKDELAKTGQVIRRKAKEAGTAVADATADARITTTIKGKLLAERDLSSLGISVNTTGGVVTLSGTVTSAEQISKAMLVAMQTDNVREVVSTLQVKPGR